MKPKIYEIGTIGVAARDVGAYVGTIKKGSRVQIVGIDPYRGYELLDLDTGIKIIETGFNSFSPVMKEEKQVETKLGTDVSVEKEDRLSNGSTGGYSISRKPERLPIGTVGFATEDHVARVGTIKKGARVQIVGIDDFRGYELLDLETGLKLIETGFNSITRTKDDLKQNDTQLASGSTSRYSTSRKSEKLPIGTVGFASEDHRAYVGTIKKGARVQIVGIDPYRGYELLDLDTGIKLIETGFNSIVPTKEALKQNDTQLSNGSTGGYATPKKPKKFSIGRVGFASRDIRAISGTIAKGSRVQIVGIDEVEPSRGYELLDLETGLKLIETGFDSFVPAKIGEIQFPIGTVGIASEDHRAYVGTIKKGAIVQIVGIDPYRGYELLDIDTGLELSETGFGSIIPLEFENLFDMNEDKKTL